VARFASAAETAAVPFRDLSLDGRMLSI
jgi:hypothetical protein